MRNRMHPQIFFSLHHFPLDEMPACIKGMNMSKDSNLTQEHINGTFCCGKGTFMADDQNVTLSIDDGASCLCAGFALPWGSGDPFCPER
jgi:hypothetical protein